jgi:uncharacterized protein (DUF924 family)
MSRDALDILTFWFEEAGPSRWFRRSDDFDAEIRGRFLGTWRAAAAAECAHWRASPEGRCAEIIVLDQFSRNLFRDDPRAFAQDGMALVLAQWAVASGEDMAMTPDQRYFTYMPYMHAESLVVHEESERLFRELGNARALDYEIRHRDVLREFGRYPGRNAALGRTSTAAEKAHLAAGGGF